MEADLQHAPTEHRKRVQEWLDAGHGSCVLREPAIASMVQNALLFFDAQRYRLLAWVLMPNHVHVLFQPMNDWPVAKIVASWKKFTAHEIFKRAKGGTPVWHKEYWDRYIRNESHLQQAIAYIHENPVKAGLAAKAGDWRWSSGYGMPGTPIS